MPRYLAKAGLFKNRLLGSFLRACGQIPVERLSSNAAGAFDAAVAAVRSGELVVVYPEGTITREPDLWPMVGKSGAARIALETRAPVRTVNGVGSPRKNRPSFGSFDGLRPPRGLLASTQPRSSSGGRTLCWTDTHPK